MNDQIKMIFVLLVWMMILRRATTFNMESENNSGQTQKKPVDYRNGMLRKLLRF